MSPELVEFIRNRNAETQAWIDEDPTNRWAGFAPDPIEDAEFYAERNIHTIEDYHYDEMASTISDLAKDAYGTRSACPNISGMSFEELSAAYDSMLEALKATNEREAEREKEAIVDFESKIAELIESGAGDRATAVKWLWDAEEDEFMSQGYFEYHLGIPYNYLDNDMDRVRESWEQEAA